MPRLTPERMASARRRVLDGARRAFARHGYEGATVRVLEEETGLSRGAIFHHFPDKESLFLALADDDAAEMAAVVAEQGLVGVMRELPRRDAGWLGVQLEVSRRLRTDPEFRRRWQAHLDTVARAAEQRLRRQQSAGVVRDDVPVDVLVRFLTLVLDGLVLHCAVGTATGPDLGAVLDLVEETVRRGTTDHAGVFDRDDDRQGETA